MNLDQISDRLMYRVQYRNFGDYETLVGNHTVDTNNPAGIAGVHWFELRNTGTDWAMYQQGTYGPSDSAQPLDGQHRHGRSGNIALGYSVSSSSIYPGIRYVGRLPSDTLSTLGQSETTLIAGGGYQSSSDSRWGDYSAMQVDPPTTPPSGSRRNTWCRALCPWVTRLGAFTVPVPHVQRRRRRARPLLPSTPTGTSTPTTTPTSTNTHPPPPTATDNRTRRPPTRPRGPSGVRGVCWYILAV